jgi:hypothetical protein
MNEKQKQHGAWIARYLKEQIHDRLVSRGEKYNGEDYDDPFIQFKQCAQLTYGELNEETLDHAFRYMINHKITRLANNRADFDDESRRDTIADAIGYLTLYAEWLGILEVPKDLPTEPGPIDQPKESSFKSFKKYLLGEGAN